MQRHAALERLSPVHALALRLDALGADSELIAARLGIAPEAVAPLLEVAAGKLARAQQELDAGAPRHLEDATDPEERGSPVSGETTDPLDECIYGKLDAYQAKTSRPIPLVALIPDRVVVRTAGQ